MQKDPIIPSPTKKPLRYFLILGIVILLLVLFLFGLLPRLKQEKQNNANANRFQKVQVRVQEAKVVDKAADLILPSSAVAFHVTPLWARTNGYLKNFYVDIGDVVKQGQLLADIDTPEVDQQWEQSIAELNSAKAKKDIAQITAKRWQTLFKDNPEAIPLQEVEEKGAILISAEADVVSAEKNVARLRDIQQFKKIYAPFDGIITKRDIDVGSLINAGNNGAPQQLFEIAEIDVIRFFVDVPQNFFRQIKDGLPAKINIREYPEKYFQGFVARYAKALDPIARTLRTEVDVENTNNEILPGLYAEVRFTVTPDANKFIVPTQAVIIRSSNPMIALIDKDSIAHLKKVEIGHDYGDSLEIIEGLKEGDQIIINPTEKILDGTSVHIVN